MNHSRYKDTGNTPTPLRTPRKSSHAMNGQNNGLVPQPSLRSYVTPERVPIDCTDSGACLTSSSPETRDGVATHETDILVERVDSVSSLSEGDIVGFEFVSEDGKWMWSIGTILALENLEGHNDATSTESGLVPLVCWRMTEVSEDDSNCINRYNKKTKGGEEAFLREACVKDIERAKNVADAARKALQSVDRSQWVALRHMQRPPPVARLVVQAVFSLLHIELLVEREQEEWSRMLRFLRLDAFDNLLSDEEVPQLDDTHAKFITEHYLSNPLFLFDEANACNRVLGLMHKWVTSEVRLYERRASLRSIDEELAMLKVEGGQNDLGARVSDGLVEGIKSVAWAKSTAREEPFLQSFQSLGFVSFSKGDETTVVLRSSVFCKLIISSSSNALRLSKMTFERERLTLLCSAASIKNRQVTSVLPVGNNEIIDRPLDQLSGVSREAKLMYEQAFGREHIMVRELESLYEKHVLFTSTQLQFFRHLLASGFTNFYNKTTVRADRPTATNSRSKDLGENLWNREGVLSAVQTSYSKAIPHMHKQLKEECWDAYEHGLIEIPVSGHRFSFLQCEEEMSRIRLSALEAEEWSTLLLFESTKAKEIAVSEVCQKYTGKLNELHKELLDYEKCCMKTVKILDRCLEESDVGKTEGQSEQQKAVRRALEVLGGQKKYDQSHEELTRRLPVRTGLPLEEQVTQDYMIKSCDVEDDNIIILKDRLVEALRDREIIQEMLANEESKNRVLAEQKDALISDLKREMEKHVELEDMVRKMQGDVSAMMKSVRPSLSPGEAVSDPPFNDKTNAREHIFKLRSIIAEYETQLADLLSEEEVGDEGPSFAALRVCLSRWKDLCATLREERDAHAAEVNLLESYLKTAADALEDALLHDERWCPRTTKLDHTAWHWKAFPGNDWERVIINTPEALKRALKHDISAACHLPEEYVLELFYKNRGSDLYVSFKLRHDPSITAEEIICRLNECNYYELEKLYTQRFVLNEGVDFLKKDLHAKEEEIRRLSDIITRLQSNVITSGSVHRLYSEGENSRKGKHSL